MFLANPNLSPYGKAFAWALFFLVLSMGLLLLSVAFSYI